MEKKWIHNINKPIKAGALCLGAFDGIHIGHKALIARVLKQASPASGLGLSFSPHPREFFYSKNPKDFKPFQRILPEETNASLMESEGLEALYFVEFNEELSQKNTNEFLDYIKNFIDFSALVVGFDFRLGNQRKGGQEDIKFWCDKNKVEFVSVDKITDNSKKVSSTLVREALRDNNFKKAEALLGHSYYLEGLPVKDQGLGGKLGFPTMNIKLPKNLVLRNGVYSAVVQIDTKLYHSVVNLGQRPTVEKNADTKTLEVHILENDFEGSKGPLKVVFKGFIRSELKFESLTDLSLQVQKDILECKAFFKL